MDGKNKVRKYYSSYIVRIADKEYRTTVSHEVGNSGDRRPMPQVAIEQVINSNGLARPFLTARVQYLGPEYTYEVRQPTIMEITRIPG